MTNKVEKGQRYKGQFTGNTYEIVCDPFEWQGISYIAWHSEEAEGASPEIASADHFEENHYTLILEPKFKVGDRVTYQHGSEVYEIVAISPNLDPDGDFAHLVKSDNGYFSIMHNPKAAE